MNQFKCVYCQSSTYRYTSKKKRVVECKKCGLRTVLPPREIEYKDEYYDTFSGRKSDLLKMWGERLDIVKRYIRSGKLLDMGAGTGIFLSLARKNFLISGTELTPYARSQAMKNYKIHLQDKELDKLSKSKYDTVTMWHVLEHFEDPVKELKTAHSLLKSKGFLFLAVPNDNSFKQRIKRVLRYPTTYSDAAPSRENHIYFFTPKTLKNVLSLAGFEVLTIKADNYYPKQNKVTGFRFLVSKFLTEAIPLQAASAIVVVAKKV